VSIFLQFFVHLSYIKTYYIYNKYLDPPKIERMPNSINVPEGENSKIKIFYSGDSLEEIILEKNGTAIPQSDHFKFTIFDDYVIIFLKEAKKNDASDYTVTLKNLSGNASGSFTINISGNNTKMNKNNKNKHLI